MAKSQHCIPRTSDFSLKILNFKSDSLLSLFFLILYRTISLNWIIKHFLNKYIYMSLPTIIHKHNVWQKVQNHNVC